MVGPITPKIRKTIARLCCFLFFSVFLFPFQDSNKNSSGLDAVFRKGKEEFFRELKLEFGLHPLKFRLLPDNIKKIENAETDIPYLFENLVNILYLKQKPAFDGLIEKGSEDSRQKLEELFIRLSKQTASSFVQSLFVEDPLFCGGKEKSGRAHHDRLDLVLSSFQGRSFSSKNRDVFLPSEVTAAGMASSWGFRVSRFAAAQKIAAGKGVKIGIISSGFGQGSEPINQTGLNRKNKFSLVGRRQPPWMGENVLGDDESGRGMVAASILAASSPESVITIYKIVDDAGSVYTYWSAMQTAQAIYKAVYDGMDVLLVTSVFGMDFDFLKDACQFAYENNVIIVCPIGCSSDVSPEKPNQFPAHYNTTIAVAGVVPGVSQNPLPWRQLGTSHYVSVAAPAFIGDLMARQKRDMEAFLYDKTWAAAFSCGLVSLLSSRIPKTDQDLSGQYFQRIYEILTRSANPSVLGFKNFNSEAGYGLIDAEKSVGEGLETYLVKVKQIEENFKKRMEERAREQQKAENKK